MFKSSLTKRNNIQSLKKHKTLINNGIFLVKAYSYSLNSQQKYCFTKIFGMLNYVILILICLPCITFGQTTWWTDDAPPANQELIKEGKVTINKDPRISKMIAFKGQTIPPAFGPQVNGFRVQLYFDQDKDNVNEARTRFLTATRGVPSYIEYAAPNYNLLIGDFRTRLEAEKWRAQLSADFPEGIVKETRIYLPKID